MKQLLQSLRDGSTTLEDVPVPIATPGSNLIMTSTSLISAGTERMLVEFGKGNIIQKARSQPDKVKMVLEKAKTDGLVATFDTVKSKLDQPIALGYCNVGTIIEANETGFSLGQRVVSNGNHAAVVSVPKNLCAVVPDNVSDEDASFTVVAAIGLQGIRLANLSLGECVVVTGLGLIGLLTIQMLRAQGCRVLGIDIDKERLAIARNLGIEAISSESGEDVFGAAERFSKGKGVDAVIVTASTKSNEPISQAAKICRKRGRIVLVGVAGIELSRSDFYEKELTFQVSCSYGPGRYDEKYEEAGQDYPIGFVRWTVQRNFEAVLDMMSNGLLKLEPLKSHKFTLDQCNKAMDLLSSKHSYLGILIDYPKLNSNDSVLRNVELKSEDEIEHRQGKGNIAFLGAGNYAGKVLIPAFKASGGSLHSISSSGGVSSVHFGKKFGFKIAATGNDMILKNPDVDTIVVATRHNLHAEQVLLSLNEGKHVFCEKPLCLTLDELGSIEKTIKKRSNQHLMVGFNRRFSPHIKKIKQLTCQIEQPKCINITINAGYISEAHWTQDPNIGGGRVIGEACHFIDLARHLVGHSILSYQMQVMCNDAAKTTNKDTLTISLKFEDGSIATVHYYANGHKSIPKERVEIYVAGRILHLDNYRILRGWGWPEFKSMRLWKQNKGQYECAAAFIDAVRHSKPAPISHKEIFEVSKVAIEVAEALRR